MIKNQNQKEYGLLKRVLIRLMNSNNRSLGTVGGVWAGFILGVILVVKEYESFPLVGKGLPLGYKIVGIFLSAGTGGNLSSYIGGSIDIVTGDKTIVDLVRIIYSYKKRRSDINRRSHLNSINNNSNNNNNNDDDSNNSTALKDISNNSNNSSNNIDLPIN